jgi:hypothetical protein
VYVHQKLYITKGIKERHLEMWVGIGFGGLLPSEELGFFCI